jgi:hypothetical protein
MTKQSERIHTVLNYDAPTNARSRLQPRDPTAQGDKERPAAAIVSQKRPQNRMFFCFIHEHDWYW